MFYERKHLINMKKELAVFLAVLTALICAALLSVFEAASGMLNSGDGTIIAFVNAIIGYFGGKAVYKKLSKNIIVRDRVETEKAKKPEEVVASVQSKRAEPVVSKSNNSALGAIIAECNIPDTLIPRVIDLYMKDPNLLSSLHGGFSAEQLDEILAGLEDGQDVSFFMNKNLSVEQMRAIRDNLPSSK